MTQSASRTFTSGTDRQSVTDDRLNIAGLSRILEPMGMGRSKIQRYDAYEEFQTIMGKKDGYYPASCLPLWKAIAVGASQTPAIVRPETGAIFVESLLRNPPTTDDRLPMIGHRPESDALVLAREVGGEVTASLQRLVALAESVNPDTVERLIGALDRHSNAIEHLPPPDDALLTVEQVQAVIPRGIAWIRRNVPSVPLGRGRAWKKSQVNAYIYALESA